MLVKCCFCGELFKLGKETIEMIDEGEIPMGDALNNSLCDDCDTGVDPANEEVRSDADPGL